jgi:hypothetical protein
MQYKNIPYSYRQWTASNGQECSSYLCKYFNFYPYHLISFPANTEQEMKDKIDELLDNRVQYEYKRKLSNAGAAAYYASKSTDDNYTGD